MHTVKELNEDRTAITHICLSKMPVSSTKHMAKAKPIFFDKDLEAIECSVERI